MGQSPPALRKLADIFAGKRILIVEDEYFLADDLAGQFRELGADVIGPLPELDEAQSLVHSGAPIDVAVLDVNIRDEMVFPLARALRDRDIDFVFTSGYDKASIRPEFADVPLWEKPLDFPAVAEGVADLLQGR